MMFPAICLVRSGNTFRYGDSYHKRGQETISTTVEDKGANVAHSANSGGAAPSFVDAISLPFHQRRECEPSVIVRVVADRAPFVLSALEGGGNRHVLHASV
jgi:hypothetical protein